MSLLHQDAPEATDDAARGEAFTRGTSHIVIASILAALLVSLAIVFYFVNGQKPPAAAGEILGVWACPLHEEGPATDANGDPMAPQSSQQILLFVQVRLRNQSPHPLTLFDKQANLTLPGSVYSSTAATAQNYERIFRAYPKLPAPHQTPLATEFTLAPGQSVDGSFLAAFKLSKQQWDARKNLTFGFSFRYQPRLILTPRVPVVEFSEQ